MATTPISTSQIRGPPRPPRAELLLPSEAMESPLGPVGGDSLVCREELIGHDAEVVARRHDGRMAVVQVQTVRLVRLEQDTTGSM